MGRRKVTTAEAGDSPAALRPHWQSHGGGCEPAASGLKRPELFAGVIAGSESQIGKDLQVKLDALLTEAQKRQWKERLGKPVDPGVIYGGL